MKIKINNTEIESHMTDCLTTTGSSFLNDIEEAEATKLVRELQNHECQKRRKVNPEVELKKVTMKINKEVYEQFSDYVRNELGSNVTAEVEKFMKNIKEPKVVINGSTFLTKEEVSKAIEAALKK